MLKVVCSLDRPLAPDRRSYAMLTPACEDDLLAGVIADHLRCPDRAPAGRGLLGLMAAPRRIPDLLALSPQDAADRLTAAAERYVPGLRAACSDHLLVHWPEAMPELTPGRSPSGPRSSPGPPAASSTPATGWPPGPPARAPCAPVPSPPPASSAGVPPHPRPRPPRRPRETRRHGGPVRRAGRRRRPHPRRPRPSPGPRARPGNRVVGARAGRPRPGDGGRPRRGRDRPR